MIAFRSSIAVMLLTVSACGGNAVRSQPINLSLLTGGTGGSFYPLGTELARIYSGLPGVHATAYSTVASVFNVLAIQAGKGDVAFTQADVAYLAYWRGIENAQKPLDRLRGMAVLWINTVQLVVRRDSPIRSFQDLRGRRVGVGQKGSGTEIAARIVIEGHGLNYAELRTEPLSFADVVPRMDNGTLDAGFVVASYPVTAIREMNAGVGVRVVSVSSTVVNRIREQYPFMRPVTIPAGTYAGQSEDVTTVGVDNILVCRADLPDQVAYELTKTLFNSLPALARSDAGARLMDPDQGPITPIPLHPGAARFYREREILQ